MKDKKKEFSKDEKEKQTERATNDRSIGA